MAGLEHEDDWDSEEFQTAFKIVLKFEIQSLLNRLSQHGEETVLFTASMEDNAVGHIASNNCLEFAEGKEVGDLKNKFLSFVTGSVQQSASRQMMLQGTTGNARANIRQGGPPQQFPSQVGGRVSTTGLRGSDRDTGTMSDPDTLSRRLETTRTAPGQPGKLGAKRQLEDSSVPKDKFTTQPLSPKRRKTENAIVSQSQSQPQQVGLGARPKQPLIAASKAGNKPGTKLAETLPQFPNPRLSSGQKIQQQQQQKADIKLNTTKTVKSGFVEERLSQAEFEMMVQKFKETEKPELHGEGEDEEEEEEDYGEEEDDDDDYNEMLEEGEIRFPYMDQQPQHIGFQKKQTLGNVSGVGSPSGLAQKQQPMSAMAPVSKPGSAIVNVSSAISTTKSAAGKITDSETGKKLLQQMPMAKSNSAVLAASSNKMVTSATGKKLSDDSKAPESREKESDGNTNIKKSSEQSQVKAGKDLSVEQRSKDEGEKDKSGNTQKKDGQPNSRFSDNVDDMDTEDLIKMVKARHAESQSDADKQIQAKLGQLSSKLSWVVEYPKDGPDGQPQQPPSQQQLQQRQQLMQMQGAGASAAQMANMMYPGMGDYMDDEDEEDYDDDDDFDEEDLDEDDRAVLANMRRVAAEKHMATQKMLGVAGAGPGMGGPGVPRPGQGPGQFDGEIGDEEEYPDYDEEMEEFDAHHRVFDPAAGGVTGVGAAGQMATPGEQLGMPAYAGEDGDQVPGYPGYQRPASPSLDNYLLMGPMMAKCLVCNRIIRKTEIKQHNKLHDEEFEEEGDGEEGDGQGGLYEEQGGEYGEEGGEFEGHRGEFGEAGDEGDGMHDMGGEYDEQGQEYPDEGEMAEEEEDPEDLAEFTAEPLVAEKLVAEKISPADSSKGKKADKSTVCELCNKTFCSSGNLKRHMQSAHDMPPKPDIKCPVCGRGFKQSGGLSRHMKTKHPHYDKEAAVQGAGDMGAVTGSGSDGDGVTGAPDGGAEEGKENESSHSQTNT